MNFCMKLTPNYLVSIRKGFFPPWRRQSSCLLVRRTDVRLRATTRFPCQDEKPRLSDTETNSFSSGVSG